jgi:hypothetical protein
MNIILSPPGDADAGPRLEDNFSASLACLLLEYLLAEGWFGPALSIMQERVPAEARGVTISIYLFISGIMGSLSPALLGHLDTASATRACSATYSSSYA